MVTVSQIEFTVAASWPVPRNPPVLSTHGPHICRTILPSDTVHVAPMCRNKPSRSSFYGRVIDIVDRTSASESGIVRHPDNHLHDSTSALIKMQLIIAQHQSEDIHPQAQWPIFCDETRMATRGLILVAHTNLLLLVHPSLITDLIHVLHSSQCTNQTFGAVAGRENCFHTSCNALFEHSNSDSVFHEMQIVLPTDYLIFGPSTNSILPCIVTETEREVEMEYFLHRVFHKLLVKLGKIGGTATCTEHFGRGDWWLLSTALGNLDSSLIPRPSAIKTSDTPQPILRGDLSLKTELLPTTMTTIIVSTPSQFAALRSCLSNIVGIGIKKRAPNSTDRKYGRTVFDLQRGDVVHLVDLDLDGYEEEAEGNDWFPADAVGQRQYFRAGRNYCRFRYDSRVRELRVTIKAIAIKVDVDAEPMLAFLEHNGIPFAHDNSDDELHEDGLRLCRGLIIDDEAWIISRIDREDDVVTLVQPDTQLGVSMTVSIVDAIEGLIPGL